MRSLLPQHVSSVPARKAYSHRASLGMQEENWIVFLERSMGNRVPRPPGHHQDRDHRPSHSSIHPRLATSLTREPRDWSRRVGALACGPCHRRPCPMRSGTRSNRVMPCPGKQWRSRNVPHLCYLASALTGAEHHFPPAEKGLRKSRSLRQDKDQKTFWPL